MARTTRPRSDTDVGDDDRRRTRRRGLDVGNDLRPGRYRDLSPGRHVAVLRRGRRGRLLRPLALLLALVVAAGAGHGLGTGRLVVPDEVAAVASAVVERAGVW
ncbi:hypothetical protein, partial [Cellulomonas bogoriensis]|uniref:hypothetical protein n=1 Tax=Cellulomonas bogoriensis TaxID=301388 RepID=UPI00054D9EFA